MHVCLCVCVYASVCDDSERLCCFEVNNDRRIAVRVNGRGQPGMMRTQSEHCCAIQHRQKLETRHTGSKWEHKANTQTLYVQTHTLCVAALVRESVWIYFLTLSHRPSSTWIQKHTMHAWCNILQPHLKWKYHHLIVSNDWEVCLVSKI